MEKLYALVHDDSVDPIGVFQTDDEAAAALCEALADEPGWADRVRVEVREFPGMEPEP